MSYLTDAHADLLEAPIAEGSYVVAVVPEGCDGKGQPEGYRQVEGVVATAYAPASPAERPAYEIRGEGGQWLVCGEDVVAIRPPDEEWYVPDRYEAEPACRLSGSYPRRQ